MTRWTEQNKLTVIYYDKIHTFTLECKMKHLANTILFHNLNISASLLRKVNCNLSMEFLRAKRALYNHDETYIYSWCQSHVCNTQPTTVTYNMQWHSQVKSTQSQSVQVQVHRFLVWIWFKINVGSANALTHHVQGGPIKSDRPHHFTIMMSIASNMW